MNDCATQRMRFETQTVLALEAAFDGGRITSDGGLLWLAQADSQLGLCDAISEHIPEWRKRKGLHSLSSLVRQRVFQIACGYEDQNDSNSLREDPLFKLVCGSLPESGADLWQANPPSRAWRMRWTLAAVSGCPRLSSSFI
jgi:Transposase DDE domain group 1